MDKLRDALPPALQQVEQEIRAYFRALPQLIADGESGRYVVIKGDVVYDTWDSFRDARQFGHGAFDDGKFLTQPVDPKMLTALEHYFGPAPVAVPTEDYAERVA